MFERHQRRHFKLMNSVTQSDGICVDVCIRANHCNLLRHLRQGFHQVISKFSKSGSCFKYHLKASTNDSAVVAIGDNGEPVLERTCMTNEAPKTLAYCGATLPDFGVLVVLIRERLILLYRGYHVLKNRVQVQRTAGFEFELSNARVGFNYFSICLYLPFQIIAGREAPELSVLANLF